MIPASFTGFFAASAGAGAALVGLLFVAISVIPDQAQNPDTQLERQAAIETAFSALLNDFLISIAALIPNANLGYVTVILGSFAAVNTCTLGWRLLTKRVHWTSMVRRVILILLSLVSYGYEVYFGSLLLAHPNNVDLVYSIVVVLLISYANGVIRAWELVGGRQYKMFTLSNILNVINERQRPTETNQATSANSPEHSSKKETQTADTGTP